MSEIELMSLRRKNFIVIITTLITLVVILFVVSQFIILRQFKQQQEDVVYANIERARYAVNQHLESLSSISSDWAYWDDTYQFVSDTNPTYISLNLTDSTLENLQLDFMIFVNAQGKVVYSVSRENDELVSQLVAQPKLMQSLLEVPTQENVNTGIVVLGQQPTAVASRDILNSQMNTSPAGVIIMGRMFSTAIMTEIGRQTQMMTMLTALDTPQPTSDFTFAKSQLTLPDAPAISFILKDQTALGYTLINDIQNQPVAMLQVRTLNRIYQAGKQAVLYILVALLVSGLVFGTVIIWLIERLIISRLAYMDRRIYEIGNTNDLSARITMSGNDELSRFAATINDFFAKREQSQEQQLKELNITLTRLNAELSEKITDLRENQKYKDRFFAHASHEFRTPLSIMRTRLYLARRKPEQWEGHLDALEDTLEHLINIIEDIFDLTRLSDHKMTLNLQPVELKTFIEMMIKLDVNRSEKQPQRICHEFTHEALPVMLDHANFARAYEKAMKYMTDFSPPDAEIWVTLNQHMMANKAYVALTMASRGLHIHDADIPDMFSPFFQVSEGTIRNTGLNLAIARQIVHLHSGTLSAQNDTPKGSGFVFNLPLVSHPK